MTIADVNSLPTITLNVTGREGSGTSVTVINQESKEHIQASSFSYTQNELLVVTLSDVDFLNSIEETTTLSVILYDNNIPLYRDIVRFSGEMNTASDYIAYNNEDDYFIYEAPDDTDADNVTSYGDDDISGYSPSSGSSGSSGSSSGSGSGSNNEETGSSSSTTIIPQSALAGKSLLTDLNDDTIVESTNNSVVYDTNNNGRGEMKLGNNYTYLQSVEETFGDFKVRSAEYGTFNSSPSSLEAITVYDYDFNANNGNFYGYSAQFLDGRNPDLVNHLSRDFGNDPVGNNIGERPYAHFINGRDNQLNETITTLRLREENSLPITNFERTIYVEDSSYGFSVGDSVYSDQSGTSLTDFEDSFADVDDLSRYHFIYKNGSTWQLIKCTDGIVTHVEDTSNNYIRFSEMYRVYTYGSAPDSPSVGTTFADRKAWIESILSHNTTVFYEGSGFVNYTNALVQVNTAVERHSHRLPIDNQDSTMAPVGSKIFVSTESTNTQRVFHKQIATEDAMQSEYVQNSPSRYYFQLLAQKYDPVYQLNFYEMPMLFVEKDRYTGLISNRAWIQPQ